MTIIIDGTVGANKAVVLDSNGKLPAIDGSLLTTLNATQVTTGSIATARIDTGTTNGKVLVLDGSGNMPAIAAGAMTGVSSATKSASDPTISTNPATGLGTKWINTTSGEIYILTDATAGANVWTSTGGTSGDVTSWGGQTYGYASGGTWSPDPANEQTVVEKFSFASDGNAIDHGDLWNARFFCAGNSASAYGYVTGGEEGSAAGDIIQKFAFAGSNVTGTDVGNLTVAVRSNGGSSSSTYGYCLGGYAGPTYNVINKFAFATDGDASDVGDMTSTRLAIAGTESETDGYVLGGNSTQNIIDKFSFSSDGNATDRGDLAIGSEAPGSASSGTHGYCTGGYQSSTPYNQIQKFAFANSTNATDIADLTTDHYYPYSWYSGTYGYNAGTRSPYTNVCDKFPFASDTNATDVGDLSTTKAAGAGQQY